MSSKPDLQKLHPMLRDGYEVLDKFDSTVPEVGDQRVIENLEAFGAT